MGVRLGFLGNVMLGRLVSERLPKMTAEAPWGDIHPLLNDLIVVSAHLGPNMVTQPTPALHAFKTRMIHAGADLIHGHSAHIFQGIDRAHNGLILHDCGDFLDDYAVDPELHNDWSFLYCVAVDDSGRLTRLEMVPVTLDVAAVNRANDRIRDTINRRMIDRSHAFGVQLEETSNGLALDLRNQVPPA